MIVDLEFDENHVQRTAVKAVESVVRLEMEQCGDDFIDAMILSSEKIDLEIQSSITQTAIFPNTSDSQSASVVFSANIYEPIRRCTHFAPPKSYHRSLWISMSRRALGFRKASDPMTL